MLSTQPEQDAVAQRAPEHRFDQETQGDHPGHEAKDCKECDRLPTLDADHDFPDSEPKQQENGDRSQNPGAEGAGFGDQQPHLL